MIGAAARASGDPVLDDAAARLERVLAEVRAGGAVVSFDAGPSSPEGELLHAIVAPEGEAVSFSGPGDEDGGGKVEQFFDKLMDKIGVAVRVETRDGAALVAATRVDLDGDLITALGAGAAAPDIERHRLALAAALAEHQSNTRLVLATVEAAVKIAVAAGTGNPWLALPAAWKFIKGVKAEADARKKAT